ncbi:MAG: hypothetical protein Q9226_001378 [Calogaya cf. arnoldii]
MTDDQHVCAVRGSNGLGNVLATSTKASSMGKSKAHRGPSVSSAEAMRSSSTRAAPRLAMRSRMAAISVKFEAQPMQQMGALDGVRWSFSYMVLPELALAMHTEVPKATARDCPILVVSLMMNGPRDHTFITIGIPLNTSDSAVSVVFGNAKNPLSVQSEDMNALVLGSKGQQVHSWAV